MNKLVLISLAISATLAFSVLSMGNIGVADAKRQSANNDCPNNADGISVNACVAANVDAKLECIQANVIASDNQNC